ncbi:hypothetical protein EST38_g11556 [Candolleomyces aberdarensis]|uniref:Uncharacterized protein n=1 Tax=Candolleomyces aberdarensis TaxID=2316362 RepID=A0A4Q2D6V9_9AGAR|nr:hypothetical protein EST38_g11556 [Candolleomyces aberdarensis]
MPPKSWLNEEQRKFLDRFAFAYCMAEQSSEDSKNQYLAHVYKVFEDRFPYTSAREVGMARRRDLSRKVRYPVCLYD